MAQHLSVCDARFPDAVKELYGELRLHAIWITKDSGAKETEFPWMGPRRQPILDVSFESLTSESVASPQPSSVHCAGTLGGSRLLTRARLEQKERIPKAFG